MAFIPVPNTAYLVVRYLSDSGKPLTNGFGFFKSGGWDVASLTVLTAAVEDAWIESLQALMSTAINLVGADAVDLTDAAGAYAESIIAAPPAGTRAGAGLPLHSAMSVTTRTGLRGRSFRGRIYHTGLTASDLTDDRKWSASVVAAVTAGYETFISALETEATADFSVISRYEDGVARAFGLHTEVTQVQGRAPVATVRKRVSAA